MSKVTSEITAIVGKYKDQNGQEKTAISELGPSLRQKTVLCLRLTPFLCVSLLGLAGHT